MPVRMVALRKHYVSEARKEYNAGETYVVHDKRAAEKLERRMKAKPQPQPQPETAAAPVAAPQKVRTRALTAEAETPTPTPTPAPAPHAPPSSVALPTPDLGTPALATAAVPDAGETAEREARYARRDLRAEEA